MTQLAVFALALAGVTSVALATERLHREVFGQVGSRQRRFAFRIGGGLLLTLSAAAAIGALGTAFGTVAWCGAVSVSAIAMVFGAAFRPRWTLYTSALAGSAGTVVLIAEWLFLG